MVKEFRFIGISKFFFLVLKIYLPIFLNLNAYIIELISPIIMWNEDMINQSFLSEEIEEICNFY